MNRLAIDWTRCDGHGLCAELVDGIDRDEWGFPILDPDRLAQTDPRELHRAVSVCPALALRLSRA